MCIVPSQLYTVASEQIQQEVKKDLDRPDLPPEEAEAAIAGATVLPKE